MLYRLNNLTYFYDYVEHNELYLKTRGIYFRQSKTECARLLDISGDVNLIINIQDQGQDMTREPIIKNALNSFQYLKTDLSKCMSKLQKTFIDSHT